jgi:hypothetical protein
MAPSKRGSSGHEQEIADPLDGRMGERVAEPGISDKQPKTLSPTELDLGKGPLTRAPVARR